MEATEKFPVSDPLQVLGGKTIYKSKKTWIAVVKYTLPTTDQQFVALYKWKKRNDSWKRDAKFIFVNEDMWKQIQEAINTLAGW